MLSWDARGADQPFPLSKSLHKDARALQGVMLQMQSTCWGGQGSASGATAHEFHCAGADKERPHVRLAAKTLPLVAIAMVLFTVIFIPIYGNPRSL